MKLDSAAQSIDLFNGNILLGLKNGSIVEMAWSADGKAKPKTVMISHCDGETWGLEVCPTEGGETRLITSGDDNRILAYNPKTFEALCEGQVNDKKAKKKKGVRGGASSMSSMPANNQSRCVAYNPSNQHLAVADNTGVVTIRKVDWAEVDAGKAGALDNVIETLFKKDKNTEWIECMSYSPCGKYLAVGSHDNVIYVMEIKKADKYAKAEKLKGHSSFITSLDWSQDSANLRSVCGAYELLFFKDSGKKGFVRDPSGASNTVSTVWNS